jgi:hypothetical protein
VALGVLVVYPLVQLVPLPDFLWRLIPGHDEYVRVLEGFGGTDAGFAIHAISVVPSATEAGWLALLPPLACLFAGSIARTASRLLTMAVFAGLEALLGLLQVRAGRDSVFYWLSDISYGTATGTFVNHNHFAAMLAMTLPIIVGLLVTAFICRRRLRPPAFAFDPDAISPRISVFSRPC